jgi:hypothetical protein
MRISSLLGRKSSRDSGLLPVRRSELSCPRRLLNSVRGMVVLLPGNAVLRTLHLAPLLLDDVADVVRLALDVRIAHPVAQGPPSQTASAEAEVEWEEPEDVPSAFMPIRVSVSITKNNGPGAINVDMI